MNARDQDSVDPSMNAPGGGAHPRRRMVVSIMMWIALTAFGLIAVVIMLAVGGVRSPFSDTEVTREKPFADFVGREYRVTGNVNALAWNDFPDKTKILVVSLMRSPGARNRFVSYRVPLKIGQRVRIVSAWRHFELVEFSNYYLVSAPGAGLPEGVPIRMHVNSDGVPDPLVYEALQSNNTPHADARANTMPHQTLLAARAGGRER
jgi:hypothetical protein